MLTAAIDSDSNIHDQDITERLLMMPGRAVALPGMQASLSNVDQLESAAAHITVPVLLETELSRQKARILSNLETRNLSFFSQETEKLDSWADDLKVGLEREIKELDRQIKDARTRSKGAATLSEKLAVQKEQRDHEGNRDRKRRELFQRQDEIQSRRDTLIDELEKQLLQQVTVLPLFACEWAVA